MSASASDNSIQPERFLKRKRIKRIILKRITAGKKPVVYEDIKRPSKSKDNMRRIQSEWSDSSVNKEMEESDTPVYLVNEKEEKIILLKNDVFFTFSGKGNLKVYFGSINIFGSSFLSFDESNATYPFDFSNLYPLFPMETIKSSNKYTLSRLEILIETENRLRQVAKKHSKLFNNLKEKSFYTILHFTSLSDDFTFSQNLKGVNLLKSDNFLLSKYGQLIEYPVLLDKNNCFLIAGKRNSGKSVFATYLLNKLMVNHAGNNREVYLLDCDAGQPLLTEPFCVSLVKLNQPILNNYPTKTLNVCRTILKCFVEENNQVNYWQNYLFVVESLIGYFRLHLNQSRRNYLIVNTNGYTDGLGYTFNSKLIELVKPHAVFYIRNQFSGRGEKALKLENFIYERFSRSTITINNNFNLDAKMTTYLKNLNRQLYLYTNLLSEFSLSKMYQNESQRGIPQFLDVVFDRRFHDESLVEIPFADASFCFDGFTPSSELEAFMAINLKMCVFLTFDKFAQNRDKYKMNQTYLNELHVIDRSSLVEKNFISFGIVLNVDILRKKLIVLSNALRKFVTLSSADNHKVVVFRNTQIDGCLGTTNRHESDNLFEKVIENMDFYGAGEDLSHKSFEVPYFLRNALQ